MRSEAMAQRAVATLNQQTEETARLDAAIARNPKELGYGG